MSSVHPSYRSYLLIVLFEHFCPTFCWVYWHNWHHSTWIFLLILDIACGYESYCVWLNKLVIDWFRNIHLNLKRIEVCQMGWDKLNIWALWFSQLSTSLIRSALKICFTTIKCFVYSVINFLKAKTELDVTTGCIIAGSIVKIFREIPFNWFYC